MSHDAYCRLGGLQDLRSLILSGREILYWVDLIKYIYDLKPDKNNGQVARSPTCLFFSYILSGILV